MNKYKEPLTTPERANLLMTVIVITGIVIMTTVISSSLVVFKLTSSYFDYIERIERTK